MRPALLIAAALVALGAASVAEAQTPGGGGPPQPLPGTALPGRDDAARTTANDRAMEPERLARTPTARRRNAVNAAREAVATASLACDVTAATHVGQAGDTDVYEVVCADAPGWLVLTGEPIQTFNCLALEVGGDGDTRCAAADDRDAGGAARRWPLSTWFRWSATSVSAAVAAAAEASFPPATL